MERCPKCGMEEKHQSLRYEDRLIYVCELSRVIFADDGTYTLEPAVKRPQAPPQGAA